MCETGLMANDLALCSAEVIAHRSRMMAEALAGKTPLMQAEFFEMWHEKLIAGMAAATQIQKHLVARKRKSSWEDMAMSSISMWGSLMKPYHTKARSNARRVRKLK